MVVNSIYRFNNFIHFSEFGNGKKILKFKYWHLIYNEYFNFYLCNMKKKIVFSDNLDYRVHDIVTILYKIHFQLRIQDFQGKNLNMFIQNSKSIGYFSNKN